MADAKKRNPIDVLTDDVMSGVDELVRQRIADRHRMFLYSSSNGASAINQLLTQTREFRAAVSHGGVADWLGYYRQRIPLGDNTIPGFLGGKKPEDHADLYRRISPMNAVDKITTPLLLAVGEKDVRFQDTVSFFNALKKANQPVTLVRYPNEGHEITDNALAQEHVAKAIAFFKSFGAN